jgi:hypothetical protein
MSSHGKRDGRQNHPVRSWHGMGVDYAWWFFMAKDHNDKKNDKNKELNGNAGSPE